MSVLSSFRREFSWSLLSTVVLCGGLGGLGSLRAAETFGAEANPTGQPIGGGRGYSAGPEREDAAFRVRTLTELTTALKAARPGDLVWIESDAEIDFTGTQIVVPEKVTLAGDRGRDGAAGPLLFARHTGGIVFVDLAPGSRLSGVRVRGSNPPLRDLDVRPSDPEGYGVACANAEVDNCEVSQFQRGGVGVFRNSDFSHVHHNYIHDVASYPLFVGRAAGDGHVFEANRVEYAWHAVGCAGDRGCGYVVRYNEFVRVARPKSFESSGADPPNWCLDMHDNDGATSKSTRPPTRKLVVRNNTFLAASDVRVGDGGDLLETRGLYPKYDVYVGFGHGMTTTVEIDRNRFLLHRDTGSREKFKPFGRALRIVGLRGHPKYPDDPLAPDGRVDLSLGENRYGGD